MKKKTRVIVNTSSLYDSINATLNDSSGHHSPTGSVLLASNTSKAAVNMRKLATSAWDVTPCRAQAYNTGASCTRHMVDHSTQLTVQPTCKDLHPQHKSLGLLDQAITNAAGKSRSGFHDCMRSCTTVDAYFFSTGQVSLCAASLHLLDQISCSPIFTQRVTFETAVKILWHCAAESAVLANDLKQDGFIVISLDTGWVRTEMGNTTEELGHGCAPLDVLTSVAGNQ